MNTQNQSPDSLAKAISYIKGKGFTHLKLELEGNLRRDSDNYCDSCGGDGYYDCECDDLTCDTCEGDSRICVEHGYRGNCPDDCQHLTQTCDTCGGNGYFDCDVDHNCDYCNGSGRSGTHLTDEYCESAILNSVSPEAREALTYGRFYCDGSVDSEYTFTIPIEHARLVPEFMEAFKELSDETEHLDDINAGLHISVLTEGKYPCSIPLKSTHLRNFEREVPKLLPALFFLGSHNYKSRHLRFRTPKVGHEKSGYPAVNIYRGAIEFRLFQPCFDKPEAVFEYIETISKTLKFYGTPTLKDIYFKEFVFPEGKEVISRFYTTPEQVSVLDQGLKVLKPAGKTIEQLKRQRGFKFDHKTTLKAKSKEQIAYQEYCANVEQDLWRYLKDAVRKNMLSESQRKLYQSAKIDSEGIKQFIVENRVANLGRFKPVDFETWKRTYSYTNRGIALRLPERSA